MGFIVSARRQAAARSLPPVSVSPPLYRSDTATAPGKRERKTLLRHAVEPVGFACFQERLAHLVRRHDQILRRPRVSRVDTAWRAHDVWRPAVS
jgi:hypothetical protein